MKATRCPSVRSKMVCVLQSKPSTKAPFPQAY
jgi:hypothetical protein